MARTHGMSYSPEYRTWHGMHRRCHNPKDPAFKYYGARGIFVCPEWRRGTPGAFEAFFAHIGPRPDGTSIDRIKRDRGYEPGNVRWASAKLQSDNRIVPRKAGGDGKRMLPFSLSATERMLSDIRAALEARFGAIRGEVFDPRDLHVETAAVERDYQYRKEHIEGIDALKDLMPITGSYRFPFHPVAKPAPRERSRFGARGPNKNKRIPRTSHCSVCSSIGHQRSNCPVRRAQDKALDAKLDREIRAAERRRVAEQRRIEREAAQAQREFNRRNNAA